MSSPRVQNDPVYQLPFLYINGLIVSNDPTTPNSVVDISGGQCRDSNDVMDITVGIGNPNLEGNYVAAPLIVNGLATGVNGVDVGIISPLNVYAVYVIADSRYYMPTAGILSLSLTGPKMPFGYDSYRLVGFATTDSSSNFLLFWISGNNNSRIFTYDQRQSVLFNGTAITYTNVSLDDYVPAINNIPVSVNVLFQGTTATTSGLFMKGPLMVGPSASALCQVNNVTIVNVFPLIAQLVSGIPNITYTGTLTGDRTSIDISSFNFYV